MSWFRYLRRRRWDDERARELESYLAMEVDDNLARGLPPDEARREAHRTLGNPTRIREEIYRMNTIVWLDTAVLDLRDGWRQLRRRPLSLALSILLLTVGIGASTAAVSVAYGVLARPLPFPDSDRLATLWQVNRGLPTQISFLDLQDIRSVEPFKETAALGSGIATLMVAGEAERVSVVGAEPALLPMLGARAGMGRLLTAADAGQSAAVISHRLWTGAFQRDPAVLGRDLSLSGRTATIVGVLAEEVAFELPVGGAELGSGFTIENVDVWMPFDPTEDLAHNRAISTYEAIVKLPAGTAAPTAQRALDTIGVRLQVAYPETNRDRSFRIVPLKDQIVASSVTPIWMALAGGVFILIIACVNLVSLFLGDLPGRRQDFALRAALGAGRVRLLRQVALEGVMLAVAGGAAGVLLAHTLVVMFEAAVDLPRAAGIRFDGPVAVFAAVAAAGVALASRLVPLAFAGTRHEVRLSSTRYATSAPRIRRVLVAAQIAFALVLSTAAALLGISLRHLVAVDPGFGGSDALTLRVSAYPSRFPQKADAIRFFDTALGTIAALPGTTHVAASSSLPLSNTGTGTSVVAEGTAVPMAERPAAGWQTVTPGYFSSVGIALRAGRDFTAADRGRLPHRVVISESLAERLFPDGDAVGRRIALGPDDPVSDWHEVIGVVADVRHAALTDSPTPRAYDLFGQHWSRTMFIVARGNMDPHLLAAPIRAAIREADPGAPVFDVRTLEDLKRGSTAARSASTVLAAGIATIGLLLACTGVFGLVAGAVAARTREFGIRQALGATAAGVMRHIAGETAALAGGGLVGGLGLSLVSGRLMQSQLLGIAATDVRVLAAVAAGVLAAAALATLVPARRAARIDPAVALRIEE